MVSGRTTIFTKELGDSICALIAEGKSLRKICALAEYPHISTVLDWAAKGERGDKRYAAFTEQYTRAMEQRTEYWAEEIIDIADDDSEDRIFNEDGKLCINNEFIQRSRVKIDSRKWLMGKLKPKKYGEKTSTELTHKGMPAPQVVLNVPPELANHLKAKDEV